MAGRPYRMSLYCRNTASARQLSHRQHAQHACVERCLQRQGCLPTTLCSALLQIIQPITGGYPKLMRLPDWPSFYSSYPFTATCFFVVFLDKGWEIFFFTEKWTMTPKMHCNFAYNAHTLHFSKIILYLFNLTLFYVIKRAEKVRMPTSESTVQIISKIFRSCVKSAFSRMDQ